VCTSLSYRDAGGKVYFGRTLELTVELPYQIAFYPEGFGFRSKVGDHPALAYKARHAFVTIAMPDRIPTRAAPAGLADLKALDGLNTAGLTFSLLSYPAAAGTQQAVAQTRAILSASDLGTWVLSHFGTVAEATKALQEQPVALVPLAILQGAESPFHYVMHDASGACAVIEFHRGQMTVEENPVGVMTNGPQFAWHLTNLDNYTFLTNVDRSAATFGSYKAVQPDSGIATAGLPASNTSVGRFIRAVYYAQFTEKVSTPDAAVLTLAHIMNNFDRPRGVTIDYPEGGGGSLEVAGLDRPSREEYATEFTCWTLLADLDRKLLYVRSYGSLNYTSFDLGQLGGLLEPKVIALATLNGANADATSLLRSAKPPPS
jgi:penicillin V acylase-like amidase (Ntn superfamily)